VRDEVLSLFLTFASRTLLRRDRENGTMSEVERAFAFEDQRLVIKSGERDLSAVYVSAQTDGPALLICHGIGECVEYWGGVQELLAEMGVASLVFDYSGYGKSSGDVSTAHCEEDAMAAYRELVERGHQSIFLLGFSLGSGVAGAVADRLSVNGVILCEGFSSLRDAGMALGSPEWLTCIIPDSWRTVQHVCDLKLPVLVVHSDQDELFPISMAQRVADACKERGELLVIEGLRHNEPLFRPVERYWGPIAEWAKELKRAAVEASRR
jgi:alpha-beta hydrolase superfamily lysophospholipase